MIRCLIYCYIVTAIISQFSSANCVKTKKGFLAAIDYLNRNCLSGDPVGCLVKADRKLNGSRKHNLQIFFKHALEQILELGGITIKPECTSSEYDQIRRLENFNRNVIYGSKGISPFSSLLYYVELKRAEDCRSVYPEIFGSQYLKIDSRDRLLAEFKQPELMVSMKVKPIRKYLEWLIDFDIDCDPLDIIDAVDHVAKYANKDSRWLPGEGMFIENLRDPCLEYVEIVGKPIFEQARFVAQMFKGKDGYYLGGKNASTLVPYYQAMAHSRVCSAILSDENFAKNFASAWKERLLSRLLKRYRI